MNKAMKFLIANSRHKLLFTLIAVLIYAATATAQVPDAPNPPRLVNDFAHLFTDAQAKELEDSLEFFARKTSNQIAIVTMDDFGGMDAAQMATEIGEKWGVGGKDDRNGIVILIKPKNSTNGRAFIATGYGLEGAIPDAICRRIVDSQMIPYFKRNDYYSGVVSALKVLKPMAAGEYSKEQFAEDDDTDFIIGLIIFVALLVIMFLIVRRNGGNNDSNSSGTMGSGGFFGGPIIFGGGGGSHSSGNSGFGGGFGGFGGGSFGGGGAGGSW